jgi:hypothetical protein
MMGGGEGGGFGFNPMNAARNWRAHPFQNGLSTAAGMAVPGAGLITSMIFNHINQNRFNNAASNSYANGAALGDQAAQAGFDQPLDNSALSGSNGFGWDGPTGPNNGTDFSGAGGGMNYGGGLLGQLGGQPTGDGSAPAWYQDSTMSGADPLGLVPNYDPSSQFPGSPLAPQPGMTHQDRLDYRAGLPLNVGVGNYGISPMQVGGQNVIFGSGDPNGRYRNRGTDYGG